jgi:hypothetical protein
MSPRGLCNRLFEDSPTPGTPDSIQGKYRQKRALYGLIMQPCFCKFTPPVAALCGAFLRLSVKNALSFKVHSGIEKNAAGVA